MDIIGHSRRVFLKDWLIDVTVPSPLTDDRRKRCFVILWEARMMMMSIYTASSKDKRYLSTDN